MVGYLLINNLTADSAVNTVSLTQVNHLRSGFNWNVINLLSPELIFLKVVKIGLMAFRPNGNLLSSFTRLKNKFSMLKSDGLNVKILVLRVINLKGL